jgi:hypothetical protein
MSWRGIAQRAFGSANRRRSGSHLTLRDRGSQRTRGPLRDQHRLGGLRLRILAPIRPLDTRKRSGCLFGNSCKGNSRGRTPPTSREGAREKPVHLPSAPQFVEPLCSSRRSSRDADLFVGVPFRLGFRMVHPESFFRAPLNEDAGYRGIVDRQPWTSLHKHRNVVRSPEARG